MIGGSTRVRRENTWKRTVCWRCGVEFNPGQQHVTPSSPCRDCREALREDGDLSEWRSKKEAA